MCWHSLIGDSKIATGIPIPHRLEEDHSLQVPVDVAAAIAGVSVAVDIGSGYFIKGETCALHPIRRNKGINHVQWHLLDNGEKPIDYEDLKIRVPGLNQQERLSLEEISSTIAFVGWISLVTNCAATNNTRLLDYFKIKESSAEILSETSVTISEGSIAVAKLASLGLNWSLSKRKIRPSSRKSDSYADILHDPISRNVILCDTEAKWGWLIDGEQATLQIILHRSKVRKDYIESHVKIAAADPEQGVSAHEAMLANERLQLQKTGKLKKARK